MGHFSHFQNSKKPLGWDRLDITEQKAGCLFLLISGLDLFPLFVSGAGICSSSSVFLHHLLGKGHVLLLGLALVHGLLPVPGFPLGLGLNIQHAGLVNVNVADGGLQKIKKSWVIC